MTVTRIILIILFFAFTRVSAEKLPYAELLPEALRQEQLDGVRDVTHSELITLLHASTGKNKKLIAALLAFPFPFGIVGLHRIYLGCSPHVPVAYIATVGGGFGLLPFIDFWTILLSKDTGQFVNNGQVFMWLK